MSVVSLAAIFHSRICSWLMHLSREFARVVKNVGLSLISDCFFGKLFKSSKKHPTMQAMQGPPWLLRFRSSTVFIIATVWISSFTVRLITKPLEDLLIIAQWQDYFLYAMVRVPCPVTTNSADVLGCPHPANSTIRAGGCSI